MRLQQDLTGYDRGMARRTDQQHVDETFVVESTADLARARRVVSSAATGVIGGERADDAVMAASELLTNALEHGAGPPVDLHIRVDHDGALVVRVSSLSDDLPAPRGESPPVTEARGRGLRIVERLGDSVLVQSERDRVAVTAYFRPR